jgi:hypothetical protein
MDENKFQTAISYAVASRCNRKDHEQKEIFNTLKNPLYLVCSDISICFFFN